MTANLIHWLDLRATVQATACHLPNVSLLNSAEPDMVTCPSCKEAASKETGACG